MQTGKTVEYGYVREVGLKFEDGITSIEAALKVEGFGVLFQLDMQAKLKEKLGAEFPRYVIMGACNPAIAYQALQDELNLGLLLPCNAVVYEQGGHIYVGVVDAAKMFSVVGNPAMEVMAREVNEKLRRAVDCVASGNTGTH